MPHTRKPWRAVKPRKQKHREARWITSGSTFVAKVYGHDGQPVDENAALIAAAPDMEDVLQPFAHLARVMEPGDVLVFRGVYVTYQQVQEARRALAAARMEEL